MNQELERVKSDLETIQKAIGPAPAFGREWIHWMRRDNWLNLWWCLPGVILIASALVPFDNTQRHWGLKPLQWVGILVSAVMLGMLAAWGRMTRSTIRPAGVIREYKRINDLSAWFGLAFLAQFGLYLFWANQHGLNGGTVMSGLWLLSGSSIGLMAVTARAWVLLGWAIPLIAFGFCEPLVQGRRGGIWLGLMFVVAALLCSVIQACQLRGMEKRHESD